MRITAPLVLPVSRNKIRRQSNLPPLNPQTPMGVSRLKFKRQVHQRRLPWQGWSLVRSRLRNLPHRGKTCEGSLQKMQLQNLNQISFDPRIHSGEALDLRDRL
jgi:hypothetical protein